MTKGRVVVAGWINSPHVLAWGDALLALGYEVHLAGQQVPNWPPARDTDRFSSVHALEPGSVPGIRDRRIGRALARVIRSTAPDLVHAHWASGYGWMAARAGARPLVTSAWGSDLLRAPPRLRLRARRALRASDLVLADSAHLADAARAIAGRDIRVEVIQWGVDLTLHGPDPPRRAAARRRYGIGTRPAVLANRALGSLYNPDVLLRAFSLVRGRVPDAVLVLKHPGESLPPAVQSRLEELNLSEAAVVVGFVDEHELVNLYRAADVYVSIPSSDSSPRSVWEALACGIPTVVSDLPWAREALAHGTNALLVPIAPEPVADAVAGLLTDRAAAAQLGAAGRRLVIETVDRRRQLARLDRLYQELLARAW
jgi:glycosyltransferase involved in cell wall biosynthesis